MTVNEYLRSKANSLPEAPGVYIMKDKDNNIIYVGKSKRLKFRVSSYFTGTPATPKTARLVSLIRDFDYILCDSEIEALTLENVLIKKHMPKYNIRLKDSKTYPYIRVSQEAYPTLTVTRERHSDKAKYYGPYQSAGGAYSALEIVKRIFTLPTCKRSFPRDIGKERPCIYKQMGRCIAPCAGQISSEQFTALVRSAEHILSGAIKSTVQLLTSEMNAAAEDMEFERALILRDRIAALKRLREKQHIVSDERITRDAFALYNSPTESVLALLSVREGAVVGKNEFILSTAELTNSEDAVYLIADYYDGIGAVPKEVLLDFEISEDDLSLLSEYLSIIEGRRISVRTPERGGARALCDLARKNAEEASRQYILDGERGDKNLKRLCEILGLDSLPMRIEAYDISNIGDECITASMVVHTDGKMKKSDYRIFKINTTDGRDDYASMREAIARRLSHIGEEDGSLGAKPDLILLDGGVGHVNAVVPLIREAELDIPVFGMVKDDYHKTRALTDGVGEISIAQESGVYGFIYNIQEEAHRFAYKTSQKSKISTLTRSSLEKIKGIGPKKAKLLLSTFTLEDIKGKSEEELSLIKGLSDADAKNIFEYFRGKK